MTLPPSSPKKSLLAATVAAAAVLCGHQASAQTLTATITQGLDTTNTINVNVAGANDYALYTTENSVDTVQFATQTGTPASFGNATLANSSNTIGTDNEGPGTNGASIELNSRTSAFTFTGYSGTATTNASFAIVAPGGGPPEYGLENSTLTFTQTVLSPNESLTLYANAKYINQTFTARLTNAAGTMTLASTAVSTTDGTAQGAANDGNLASESTFTLLGATVGEKLTFVETVSYPASGRFYAQPFFDGITETNLAAAGVMPEPSTYASLGLGLLVLTVVQRFRKRRA